MAATKKSAGGRKKRPADTRSTSDKLIDAALALAAEHRWRDISLVEIAETADVSIGETLMTLPSRTEILCALIERTDRQVFGSLEDDPLDGSTKDMLFDLLMRRFDHVAGHQHALKSIAADLTRDPGAAMCVSARALKSMALTLQAAGISTDGCLGPLRAKGLGAVQLSAFRTWVDDDDPGMSATMATLDKSLDRAGRFAGALKKPGFSRRNPAEEAA